MTETTVLNLAIHELPVLKTGEKLLLSETVDSCAGLRALSREHIELIIRRRIPDTWKDPSRCLAAAERTARICEKLGIAVITYGDARYPVQLKEIWNPPYLLFVRGEIAGNDMPMVGVVGTRFPSGKGRDAAFLLGFDIGTSGLWLVSGLARGIDGSAHAGCVKASGRTCAVLGCGIDTIYPREHKKLAAEILNSGGAILSEYPPGTPPTKYRFPERNRIISGLSRGIVVVQAPVRSGALITADFALEQGRDLYVHAEGLEGVPGEGTRKLQFEGARKISALRDILGDWGVRLGAEEAELDPDIDWNRHAGRILSKLLEKELAEDLFYYQGECIRSIQYG